MPRENYHPRRLQLSRSRGFRNYYQQQQERKALAAVEEAGEHVNIGALTREAFKRPGEWQEEPHGLQGPFSPSPDTDPSTSIPDWDYYWPTRTINPPRPRTLQARYSSRAQRIEVIFREGSPASPDATWHYDQVPPEIWTAFKRNESPGRFINAVLNDFPYGPGGWGTLVGS